MLVVSYNERMARSNNRCPTTNGPTRLWMAHHMVPVQEYGHDVYGRIGRRIYVAAAGMVDMNLVLVQDQKKLNFYVILLF